MINVVFCRHVLRRPFKEKEYNDQFNDLNFMSGKKRNPKITICYLLYFFGK